MLRQDIEALLNINNRSLLLTPPAKFRPYWVAYVTNMDASTPLDLVALSLAGTGLTNHQAANKAYRNYLKLMGVVRDILGDKANELFMR